MRGAKRPPKGAHVLQVGAWNVGSQVTAVEWAGQRGEGVGGGASSVEEMGGQEFKEAGHSPGAERVGLRRWVLVWAGVGVWRSGGVCRCLRGQERWVLPPGWLWGDRGIPACSAESLEEDGCPSLRWF